MTTYTVPSIDGGEHTYEETQDRDEAIDWFTNGVEAVMDGRTKVSFVQLTVDGKVWGEICKDGLDFRPPDGGGEVLPMRKVG